MKFKTIAVIALCAAPAAKAGAQGDDQYSFGLTGGIAIPTGQLSDATTTGASGSLIIALGSIGSSFGVRFDGMYTWLPERDDRSPAVAATGDVRILALTGNVVWGLYGVDRRLYLITGIGAYGYRPHAEGTRKANDFGWNAGLGLYIASVNIFIEGRFHTFYRALPDPASGAVGKKSAQFIPVTIGFLW